MIPHNTLAVVRFELLRSVTWSRIGVWLLLVCFPVFVVGVMKYYEDFFPTEGIVGQRENEIQLYSDGPTTIALEFRSGKRVAIVRTPGQPPREMVIPGDLSRQELQDSYRQLLSTFTQTQQEVPQREGIDDTVWGFVMMGLIPGVTSLLGLLLWATPIVQSELEGRTWIYLAVRPRGRISVLLGKYLTAVVWTTLAGWTSATICVFIARPDYALRLWSTLIAVIALANGGYGALYSLIGVCVQRRAMVIAVAYTLIFEFLISFVPAVINQFTIQFRLRNLFVSFMDWRSLFPEEVGGAFLGNQPAWLHVALLLGFTLAMIVAAARVIQRTEYATADEA